VSTSAIWGTTGVIALIGVIVFGLMFWADVQYVREEIATAPTASVHEHYDAAIAPALDPCAALGEPPDVVLAHRITQLHLDHRCPRKVEALTALIQAGRMTPSLGRRPQ
jgi:hypothetical protein